MKPTNLVLEEGLLEKAKSESGLKTYFTVNNLPLNGFLRRNTFERIYNFASGGAWEGDLGEMYLDGNF